MAILRLTSRHSRLGAPAPAQLPSTHGASNDIQSLHQANHQPFPLPETSLQGLVPSHTEFQVTRNPPTDPCRMRHEPIAGAGYVFHRKCAAIYSRRNRIDGTLGFLPVTVSGDLFATEADPGAFGSSARPETIPLRPSNCSGTFFHFMSL